jgi:IclR family KDG regulon transcriptional repressor
MLMFLKEIATIDHALDIIESFQTDNPEMGVTELSAKLGLSKNNVFRLLATLEAKGYIEQNHVSEDYRLGPRILEVGQVYLSRLGFLKIAHPFLEEMVAVCDEAAYVAVLRDTEVVYLDMVQTSHPLRLRSRVGSRLPVYCTAVGKAQLAFESRDRIEEILSASKLVRHTPHTITSKSELARNLREVVETGVALDMEEWEEDVRCVGTPIRDYTGRVIAGMCISAPAIRMSAERIEKEISPLVKSTGERISLRLGYASSSKE